ncbi:DEAD/DEAH box helicase family protein, partial [Stutzerimonas stutzeri]|uniref:DEAD/DEAH box helicase family protein n=1 Tax=Stutzerimonas stutzeri TaxID=316 RepID=UPI0021AD981D
MTSSLRDWQRRCINTALEHFLSTSHFFCQATPGAGKTRMAAELARNLLDQGRIDLVLVSVHSTTYWTYFTSRRGLSNSGETL